MTTETFINRVGWIEVPDTYPGPPLYAGNTWDKTEDIILGSLLPTYPVERIAWTLGRRTPAVRGRMELLGLCRPCLDQAGSPDVLGRVA